MELEKAKKIAEEYVNSVRDQYKKIEIVGSIRRGKKEVKDIDIVAIPKFFQDKKIIRFNHKDIQIDIYLATETNYECLKLIRTGSAEHNKMICGLALRKGWKLHADGKGLMKGDDLITNTEKGILEKLLGKYIEPDNREITNTLIQKSRQFNKDLKVLIL